jgi:ribonuclease P protein component
VIPPTGSFPRDARIRRSREFREISVGGRRHASGAFVMLTRSSAQGRARLGITASRKVGNAVVRNRVKRRIREWFRRDGREQVAGLDVVVIARPSAAQLASEDTFAELTRIAKGVR